MREVFKGYGAEAEIDVNTGEIGEVWFRIGSTIAETL